VVQLNYLDLYGRGGFIKYGRENSEMNV
jgi:hypothetical protein